jgi:beta-lactamase class A
VSVQDVTGPDGALSAIAAVAEQASGHVGLAARHIESGQELTWEPDRLVQTASTVKVGIHAAVMSLARQGRIDLDGPAELTAADQVGGSGVLAVMRPGLRCTVADLCTLMIVVSDNTATNMLVDLCGGAEGVNECLGRLGYGGIRLFRKISYPPPPLTNPPAPAEPDPGGTLATASPAELCRLMLGLQAGTVVDAGASAEILAVMRHQQSIGLFPRAFLDVAEPGDPPTPDGPAMAHKTGSIGGCRAETGLLYLPEGGGTVAYAAAADELADRSMTTLAEGNEILGRLGAIVLARWWPGPGPAPIRPGWLPAGP